jgi:hypothetical protein
LGDEVANCAAEQSAGDRTDGDPLAFADPVAFRIVGYGAARAGSRDSADSRARERSLLAIRHLSAAAQKNGKNNPGDEFGSSHRASPLLFREIYGTSLLHLWVFVSRRKKIEGFKGSRDRGF